MVKLIAAFSCALVAGTLPASVVHAQTKQDSTPAPSQQVTVIGCVVRNGMVDPDKGTRLLNIEPGALALTKATVTNTGAAHPAAAPGVVQDSNTGTIPRETIVAGQFDVLDTQTFELSGSGASALGQQVGRRVEVVGRLGAAATPPPAAVTRGTAGSPGATSNVTDAGTREERPQEGSAHPSTEVRRLEVISFRGITGACQ